MEVKRVTGFKTVTSPVKKPEDTSDQSAINAIVIIALIVGLFFGGRWLYNSAKEDQDRKIEADKQFQRRVWEAHRGNQYELPPVTDGY